MTVEELNSIRSQLDNVKKQLKRIKREKFYAMIADIALAGLIVWIFYEFQKLKVMIWFTNF